LEAVAVGMPVARHLWVPKTSSGDRYRESEAFPMTNQTEYEEVDESMVIMWLDKLTSEQTGIEVSRTLKNTKNSEMLHPARV
jgi:hypothetical protein